MSPRDPPDRYVFEAPAESHETDVPHLHPVTSSDPRSHDSGGPSAHGRGHPRGGRAGDGGRGPEHLYPGVRGFREVLLVVHGLDLGSTSWWNRPLHRHGLGEHAALDVGAGLEPRQEQRGLDVRRVVPSGTDICYRRRC